MSRGIREVSTAADRAAFAAAVAGKPFFGALFGRDLALWAGNAGAPTKLYNPAGCGAGNLGPQRPTLRRGAKLGRTRSLSAIRRR